MSKDIFDEKASNAFENGGYDEYEEDFALKGSLFGFSKKAVQEYVDEITKNFSERETELLEKIDHLTYENNLLNGKASDAQSQAGEYLAQIEKINNQLNQEAQKLSAVSQRE
ncbi:MAG: hypothetical protein RR829_02435, partial [Oscillospiraceae bacterium]